MKNKILPLILLIAFLFFTGCGSSFKSDNPLSSYVNSIDEYVSPNISNFQKRYDYYEIANGNIVYEDLDTDYVNALQYIQDSDLGYKNGHYEIDNNYHIYIEPLGIDEYKDAMITYEYDALSKVHTKTVYVRYYGIYFVTKDICIVSNENNCTSYLFVRY